MANRGAIPGNINTRTLNERAKVDSQTHKCLQGPCPQCGASLNRATNMENQRAPTADDLMICIYCATILVYQADLQLRRLSESERAQLSPLVLHIGARVAQQLNLN